jgi:arylsulfatase A-like enzyme
VIVTSDNGALPGDRIRLESGEQTYRIYDHQSCGDWRGYKSHIWDGGHREPLIARWPGVVQPGTTTDALTCLTDLMATCAAIVDCDLPDDAGEDSYNVLPVLTGETLNTSIRESVIHHACFGVFAIRQGPWKLILETQGSGGWPPPRGEGPEMGAPGQLYNLYEDPQEMVNLWDDRADVVRRLVELLKTQKFEGRS